MADRRAQMRHQVSSVRRKLSIRVDDILTRVDSVRGNLGKSLIGKERQQTKLLRDFDLPEFKQKWSNNNNEMIADNCHLLGRCEEQEVIVAGSGPSIAGFNEEFRRGKVVISLCGAHEAIKGDIFIPDSTPAGWNGLKGLVGAGQHLLMPYSLYHRKFIRELRSFPEISFEWFTYSTAPRDDSKWYHREPPYTHYWSIDSSTQIPYNTGAQTATLGVSVAITMGARNIYLIGVDGFAHLVRENKELYLNEFCNDHYKKYYQSQESRDEHLRIRELRDMADRHIFSSILEYCQRRGIGLYLLNQDSHLREVLPLATAAR